MGRCKFKVDRVIENSDPLWTGKDFSYQMVFCKLKEASPDSSKTIFETLNKFGFENYPKSNRCSFKTNDSLCPFSDLYYPIASKQGMANNPFIN